jgi:hypothetical protein
MAGHLKVAADIGGETIAKTAVRTAEAPAAVTT